jgi:S1-C subfamily serine protease
MRPEAGGGTLGAHPRADGDTMSDAPRAGGLAPAIPPPDDQAWYRLPPDQWAARPPTTPPPPPGRRGATVAVAALAVAAAVGVAAVGPAVVRDLGAEPAPPAAARPAEPPPAVAAASSGAPEDGVFLVTVDGCGFIATGSGFAIDEHHVVTNAHVVQWDAHPQLRSATGARYMGRVIGVNGYEDGITVDRDGLPDVAVIEVDVPLAANLRWAAAPPRVSEVLVGMTFADGVFTPTTGTVLESLHQGFEIRGDFDHGSSGGPVMSRDGQVYGIVTGGREGGGRAFAFDVAVLRPLVEAMVADPRPAAHDCPSS